MNRLIALLSVLTFVFGVSYNPSIKPIDQSEWTAKDWVDFSIKYHDPEGNWPHFNSQIKSFSKVDRGGESLQESSRNFKMDNSKSYFYLMTSVQDLPMEVTINDENCTTSWQKKNPTLEEQNRYINDCAYGENFRNYYRYLIGLPMVLTDNVAIINPEVEDAIIEGKNYKKLTVNYAPLHSNPTWEFYINPVDGKLVRSVFIRTHKEGQPRTGEILDYPEHHTFQGMQVRTKMLWYHLDEKFLADETYVYSAI